MPIELMDAHTYQKEEIQQVLKRAVELQAASSSEESEVGLTLEELEQVARASGVDPIYVRQAAAELAAPSTDAPAAATHLFAERWVEGPFTEEAWQEVIVELQRRYDTSMGEMMGAAAYGKGKEEQYGSRRSWTHTSPAGIETQVHVIPRGDGMHLRLSKRIGFSSPVTESLMYGAFVTLVLGSLVTTLVDGSAPAIALVVVFFALASLAIYKGNLMWRRYKRRELNDLADLIAQRLSPVQPPSALGITAAEAEKASRAASMPDVDRDEVADDTFDTTSRRRSGPLSS